MTWYYSDGEKQLGPVSEEQLIELRRSGTVTADTLVWREGMANWMRYQEAGPAVNLDAGPLPPPPQIPVPPAPQPAAAEAVCAECGKIFPKSEMITHGQLHVCAGCKPVFVQKLAEGVAIRPAVSGIVLVTEEELLAREYRVEIGSSISRAWAIFQNNAGTSILTVLVGGAILFAGGLVSNLAGIVIPFINVVLPLLYTAPMIGGLLWVFLRLMRREPATVGDVFAGFATRYGHLIALGAAETFLTYLFMTPMFLLGMGMIFLGAKQDRGLDPAMLPMFALGLLFFFLGAIYVSTVLSFASQLIVDKRYGFWPAIKLSFRMVHKRWWATFGFMFVGGIILLGGALLCLVGLFVAGPVYLGMRAALYDDNFRDLQPHT